MKKNINNIICSDPTEGEMVWMHVSLSDDLNLECCSKVSSVVHTVCVRVCACVGACVQWGGVGWGGGTTHLCLDSMLNSDGAYNSHNTCRVSHCEYADI